MIIPAPRLAYSAKHPLFGEDFDADAIALAPTPPPDPPQVITEAMVNAAREAGYAAGMRDGKLAEANKQAAGLARALTEMTRQLELLSATIETRLATHAEAIARLMLATLRATFPQLCALHGEAEAVALARSLLPRLRRQAILIIRGSPSLLEQLKNEIPTSLMPLMTAWHWVETTGMAPGDMTIEWENGEARREGIAIEQEIDQILAACGIARPATTHQHRHGPSNVE
jgi:hypothetical protein